MYRFNIETECISTWINDFFVISHVAQLVLNRDSQPAYITVFASNGPGIKSSLTRTKSE